MPALSVLAPYVDAFRLEARTVYATLRDKGPKRFGRALVAGGILVLVAYRAVYVPPQKKIVRLESEIHKAKVRFEYGTQYKEVRDKLLVAYRRLPEAGEREQWLSSAVRSSLGELIAEDFKPVREQELNGLVYQTSAITLTLKFPEFFNWLLRLEASNLLMHLQSLELTKKMDQRGYNSATCEIATVIPKKRFR